MRLFEHFLAVEGLVANKKSADASGHRRTPTDQIFQPQAYACEGGIMPEADIESKSLRRLERRFKAPFLNVRQLLFQQIP